MWEQYRKTLVITQVTMAVIFLAALYLTGGNILNCLLLYAVMQFFNVAGAWYGVRLRERVRASQDRLPLSR